MQKLRFTLVKIIYDDLCIYGKVRLLLLLFIMVSAMLVIIVTHQTRCMIMEQDKFLLEVNMLDHEWSNLILEKKKLSNHIRVESIAIQKLQMRYTDPILDNMYK